MHLYFSGWIQTFIWEFLNWELLIWLKPNLQLRVSQLRISQIYTNWPNWIVFQIVLTDPTDQLRISQIFEIGPICQLRVSQLRISEIYTNWPNWIVFQVGPTDPTGRLRISHIFKKGPTGQLRVSQIYTNWIRSMYFNYKLVNWKFIKCIQADPTVLCSEGPNDPTGQLRIYQFHTNWMVFRLGPIDPTGQLRISQIYTNCPDWNSKWPTENSSNLYKLTQQCCVLKDQMTQPANWEFLNSIPTEWFSD